jgi:hypothetical protein
MSDVDLGFGGQRVPIPAHIGLFHSGADDLGEQFDFLRVALARPREAMVVFGPKGAAAMFVRAFAKSLGRDLSQEVASGKLVMFEGDSDPDTQLAAVVRTITTLVERGAAVVRVLALVAWDAPRWPAPEDFMWIESRLEQACSELPVAIVCAYDVTSMPGPALIYAGIESHRFVSIGGKVASNPLAVPPETYMTDRLLRLPWLLRDPASIEGGRTRGIHACAFFMSRDEEYATLLPLIREGIERGQGAFQVIDPERRADHLQRLARGEFDVEGLKSSQQLEVRDWRETYLADGRFEPERTLALLAEVLSTRSNGAHVVADMAWALGRAPGVGALVEYEARFNESMPRDGDTVICTYDSARFAAATMLDILRAHPVVILGGVLQDNGLYTPPGILIDELEARTGVSNRHA